VARYPPVPARTSGYVSLKKTAKKQPALIQIARELARVKGEKAASQGKLKGKS
jgi:signal recognition particle subunit SEC65